MHRPSHLSHSVLLLLISVYAFSGCASQPPVPVVSRCPKLPEAPPSLMQPPKANTALQRLEDALQLLEPTANSTLPPK